MQSSKTNRLIFSSVLPSAEGEQVSVYLCNRDESLSWDETLFQNTVRSFHERTRNVTVRHFRRLRSENLSYNVDLETDIHTCERSDILTSSVVWPFAVVYEKRAVVPQHMFPKYTPAVSEEVTQAIYHVGGRISVIAEIVKEDEQPDIRTFRVVGNSASSIDTIEKYSRILAKTFIRRS